MRVRHHARDQGDVARIEVAPEDVERLRAAPFFEELGRYFESIGYAAIEADPQGYRRGSLNAGLG